MPGRSPILFLLLMTLALAGCGGHRAADEPDEADRIQIATTTGMITDVVRRVAGDHATVTGIMAEGVDPHLYKPTRDDVVLLDGADVVFYNGLLLEGKMADVLERAARDAKPVVALAEGLDPSYIRHGAGTHEDPHIWMDAQAWARCVAVVGRELAEFDPEHGAEYIQNASDCAGEIAMLHAYVREVIASIPEPQRVLVTAHDAFGYFGRAYHIEVRGIQGISTESEAGVRDIRELVDFLVDRGIGAVFVETSVADKNVRALVEGARARGHEVRIGGTLYSDAMGAAGTWEGTYVGMIDHNATTIAGALGGSPPEGGFRAWRAAREAAP